MELIYCADGNERYAQIAVDHGFRYGARLPNTIYLSPYFVDQDWKAPDFARYMIALSRWRPYMASVLDWERPEQLPEVLKWAGWAAQYVSVVMIVPKVIGGISLLPTEIEEKPIRLGFSYPTKFGRADYSILYEMIGWPNGVHILGGPPQAALALNAGKFKARRKKAQDCFFMSRLDIRSADGNYILGLANKGLVWNGNSDGTRFEHISLKRINGKPWGDGSKKAGANYEAFRRSCENLMTAWGNVT